MTPGKPEQQTYQVWQGNDLSASRAGWSAFPADYRHTINVSANSLKATYESTRFGAWWEDHEVDVVGNGARSTRVGDVVVDPEGKAYRIHDNGFKAIDPATEKAAKDEPPLERVERQSREWKHEHSAAFIPDPATGRIGSGTHRWKDDAWGVMSEAEKPDQYQVWHREGERFMRVADVGAPNLQSALFFTLNRKDMRWPEYENVKAFVESPRSSTFGDVIVDPQGTAYALCNDRESCPHFKETVVPVEREPLKDFKEILKEATDRAMFRMDGRSHEPDR
jgi:hypothetical protein